MIPIPPIHCVSERQNWIPCGSRPGSGMIEAPVVVKPPAVSNTAINALSMGLATQVVLVMSHLVVSSLRHFIPRQVRIATYILIIATFVPIVEYLIQGVSLERH